MALAKSSPNAWSVAMSKETPLSFVGFSVLAYAPGFVGGSPGKGANKVDVHEVGQPIAML
jgi:hypothetical protein